MFEQDKKAKALAAPSIFDVEEEKSRKSQNQENHGSDNIDLGFKVFKLQKSNFHIWDARVEKTPEAIQTALFNHVNHISQEAEQEAILYELLLKSGFELSTPIEKLMLVNNQLENINNLPSTINNSPTIYSVSNGGLLICLEKQLTQELIKAIADRKPSMVICLDEGFQNNDQLKTNAVLIMKSKGVENFRTV